MTLLAEKIRELKLDTVTCSTNTNMCVLKDLTNTFILYGLLFGHMSKSMILLVVNTMINPKKLRQVIYDKTWESDQKLCLSSVEM